MDRVGMGRLLPAGGNGLIPLCGARLGRGCKPSGIGAFLRLACASSSAGDESASNRAGEAEVWTEYHLPVLAEEVRMALQPSTDSIYFDGTAGGGGHSELLLQAGARVLACDRDEAALDHAGRRLIGFGDRFQVFRGSFTDMRSYLDRAGVNLVDGILLDLGVSSRQLDNGERGFSFMRGGPLDMRMDQRSGRTAADFVREESEESLVRIFRDYGEERAAKRVAAAIVEARAAQEFDTTDQLAAIVESVLPRWGGKHPATKVFQALRIAVNDELGELERGLKEALACLKPGGKLAVITFHSLEDRVVKHFMKDRSQPTIDRPEWPAPKPNPDWVFERRLPKPVVPSAEEVKANPRARSSRLRVAVRCGGELS